MLQQFCICNSALEIYIYAVFICQPASKKQCWFMNDTVLLKFSLTWVGIFPEWNFVYFISFILRLEWQDEVGMTKNSHSRVILKGMMIKWDLTSHPSSRSFEVILTWNDLRMTKYPHSVVIPGWLGMNFRLHKKSPDFWAGPWRVQGMMWNDAGMM